jgi:UDP-N-acetylglucosamine 2-epimerase (non-hydrolysing)
LKIINVVGARPNLMKIAPIVREMLKHPDIEQVLVHTGQHYDPNLSDIFFEQLGIPKPDLHLQVGSGSHAVQTAKIMMAFEPVLLDLKPDLVLVVGDVNSTIACTLVASKLGVPVAHVEAGLRSFDRTMPEEINRLGTDALADLLFASEPAGVENLQREGVAPDKIFFVGNVMIDTLLAQYDRAVELSTLADFGLTAGAYALVTLHRPGSVDSAETLQDLVDLLGTIQQRIKVVFPIHPRTQARLRDFDLLGELDAMPNVIITGPQGYLEFLNLMSKAQVVLTDSGGVQEETTILRVPCLTLRPNTERPATITDGTNVLVGHDKRRILHEVGQILDGKTKASTTPQFWDGHAAERIVAILREQWWPRRQATTSFTTVHRVP